MQKKIFKKRKLATKTGIITLSLFLFMSLIFSSTFYEVNPLAVVRYFLATAGSTVGVSLGVPENPFNTLAQQLKEKETRLENREYVLDEREGELEERSLFLPSEIILNLILGMMIMLLSLISLNFYFDHKDRNSQIIRSDA